jgi:hypothetical protein
MLQNVKHKVSSVIPAGKRLLKTALSAENNPVWRGGGGQSVAKR